MVPLITARGHLVALSCRYPRSTRNADVDHVIAQSMISCSVCAGVLVAQSLNPAAFPPMPRWRQTSQVRKGSCSAASALADCIIRVFHMDTEPAKVSLHLQDFELAIDCPLEFLNQWFQILAEMSQYVEPSVAMPEARRHQYVANVPQR
jgi:hypothetical protein